MELIKLSAQKAKMEIYRGMLGKFFPKYYVNIILFIYFRDKSPAEQLRFRPVNLEPTVMPSLGQLVSVTMSDKDFIQLLAVNTTLSY